MYMLLCSFFFSCVSFGNLYFSKYLRSLCESGSGKLQPPGPVLLSWATFTLHWLSKSHIALNSHSIYCLALCRKSLSTPGLNLQTYWHELVFLAQYYPWHIRRIWYHVPLSFLVLVICVFCFFFLLRLSLCLSTLNVSRTNVRLCWFPLLFALYFTDFCFILITSFHLLTLSVIYSSFSSFLRWELRLSISYLLNL